MQTYINIYLNASRSQKNLKRAFWHKKIVC